MKKILHIASSSNLQSSVTRQIGQEAIQNLKANHPDANVITRDLVQNPVPHLTPAFLTAMYSGKPDASELELSDRMIDEVLASDILIVEAPMYNFTIPSVLVAWLGYVIRRGKTFNYGPSGPVGLLAGKKLILILGSGGFYSEGPMKAYDHHAAYLKSVFGFLGITDIEPILIEGLARGPEVAGPAIEAAKKKASTLFSRAM